MCIWVRLRIKNDRANALHPHEIIVAVRFYTCTMSPFSLPLFFPPLPLRLLLLFLLLAFHRIRWRLAGIIIIECGSGNGDGDDDDGDDGSSSSTKYDVRVVV